MLDGGRRKRDARRWQNEVQLTIEKLELRAVSTAQKHLLAPAIPRRRFEQQPRRAGTAAQQRVLLLGEHVASQHLLARISIICMHLAPVAEGRECDRTPHALLEFFGRQRAVLSRHPLDEHRDVATEIVQPHGRIARATRRHHPRRLDDDHRRELPPLVLRHVGRIRPAKKQRIVHAELRRMRLDSPARGRRERGKKTFRDGHGGRGILAWSAVAAATAFVCSRSASGIRKR
jgi:hypothetical protein